MPGLVAEETDSRGAALLHWAEDRRQVDALQIRIIRGRIHVRYVQSSEITVDVYAAPKGTGSPTVRIVHVVTGRTLQIMDVYPQRGFSSHECLPPTDERGDYWNSDVFLEVEIVAPFGMKIDREIRAEAVQ